ncbi:uncharacterized protein TNCV_4567941 [Trichonephila clavipes]|nr:uncharacterized protein TNCV_4567941 [Trichonephila clavipes]
MVMTWTTPELAPPLLTTTPHQREDVSALVRFNVHRCPTRRVFSGTGIELMTCLPWLDTLTTGLPQLPIKFEGQSNEQQIIYAARLKKQGDNRICVSEIRNHVGRNCISDLEASFDQRTVMGTIQCMQWSARSSDLNPIEHACDALDPLSGTLSNLSTALEDHFLQN